MLQELGGIGGLPDISTNDADNSGNGVLSALENIGVNFGAGLAGVGLNALAAKAGTAPVVAPYSSGTLVRPPGSTAYAARLPQSGFTVSSGTLVVGGLALFAVIAVALIARGR